MLHALTSSPLDPIRVLVLTGEDLEDVGSEDWDMLVGTYIQIAFARTTPE